METKKNLMACPFCGPQEYSYPKLTSHLSENSTGFFTVYFIVCEFCYLKSPSYNNAEEAIKYWNTRNGISFYNKDIEEEVK